MIQADQKAAIFRKSLTINILSSLQLFHFLSAFLKDSSLVAMTTTSSFPLPLTAVSNVTDISLLGRTCITAPQELSC